MDATSLSFAPSGPRVARLFAWVLAVLWLVAWWSWGIQVLPLVGQGGVLPLGAAACPPGASAELAGGSGGACFAAPPLGQWLAPWLATLGGDVALLAAVAAGLLLATAAACNLWPRAMLLGTALLYGAFVASSSAFFPSIGDKLLLEATALAVLLPRNRTAPTAHLLARAVVLKLYFGMGLSQWLALDNGWQRGAALREFLQDVPLPTRSGWYVSHLPGPMVSAGTKLTLLLELCVPWLAFGPRTLRLLAAAALTALQVVVANLVNDGLFSFVAVALHLFLLSDADVAAIEADIARLARPLATLFARITSPVVRPVGWLNRAAGRGAAVLLAAYLAASLGALGLLFHRAQGAGAPRYVPAHFGWNYSHVGEVRQGRVEPIFEVLAQGKWQVVELWHEPGDPWRAPRLVLPHQPRLDAQLSAAGRAHDEVAAQQVVYGLMRRLCAPAGELARLLRTPLPASVQAVRVRYDSYNFADWQQHGETGVWWTRAQVAQGPHLQCR